MWVGECGRGWVPCSLASSEVGGGRGWIKGMPPAPDSLSTSAESPAPLQFALTCAPAVPPTNALPHTPKHTTCPPGSPPAPTPEALRGSYTTLLLLLRTRRPCVCASKQSSNQAIKQATRSLAGGRQAGRRECCQRVGDGTAPATHLATRHLCHLREGGGSRGWAAGGASTSWLAS